MGERERTRLWGWGEHRRAGCQPPAHAEARREKRRPYKPSGLAVVLPLVMAFLQGGGLRVRNMFGSLQVLIQNRHPVHFV